MWSFASQASAGMAIATLTATYYALVRKNHQMERESAIAMDIHGAGHRIRNNDFFGRGQTNPRELSSSQILLKKELEELSFLNGSVSGLNIVSQHEHPWYKFQKDHLELKRIISRVNTRSSTTFSDEDFDDGGDGDASRHLVNENDKNVPDRKGSVSPNADHNGQSLSANEDNDSLLGVRTGFDRDENSRGAESVEPDDGEETLESSNEESNNNVVEKWKSVQDNLLLNRTQSPICFYKNPGFGNRYAYKLKQQTQQKSLLRSSSQESSQTDPTAKDAVELKAGESETNNTSTQFILTPVLSQSSISVCDKETQEKLRKRVQTTPAQKEEESAPAEGNKDRTLVEVTLYNEKLEKDQAYFHEESATQGDITTQPLIGVKTDPEVCNLCPQPVLMETLEETVPKVVLDEPTSSCDDNKEGVPEIPNKQAKVEEDSPVERSTESTVLENNGNEIATESIMMTLEKGQAEEAECENGATTKYSTITRPTSLVTMIPDDSWVSLPVRVYTNAMSTMPWQTFVICAAIVVIAGFLGMFLSRMANSIVLPKGHSKRL